MFVTRKTVGISDSAFEILDNMKVNKQEIVSDLILNYEKKNKWLKKYSPHLSFIGIDSNELLIRDSHLDNKIIQVSYKDNRLWCSECKPKPCMHVFYAMARPEVALLEDKEPNNHA